MHASAVSLCRGLSLMIKNQESTDSKSDHDEDAKAKVKKHHVFDTGFAAAAYEEWYDSDYFDIGSCTTSTLAEAPDVARMKRAAHEYDESMKEQYKGAGNLANGALMRCMPLIVYGHRLSHAQLSDIMAEDASLTHANVVGCVANSVYAIAAQCLLLSEPATKHRNVRAFETGEAWLEQRIATVAESERWRYEEVRGWLAECKGKDVKKVCRQK